MKLQWIVKCITLFLISLALFFMNSCSKTSMKVIDVSEVIDFDKVSFNINLNDLAILPNSLCFDDENNLYLLDTMNHRVLKFDLQGNLIKSIGKIGQGEDEIFRPSGIFIKNQILYILNNSGKNIKKYTKEGEYISSFELLGKLIRSNSFYVTDNAILVNQLEDKNEEGHPLSVYSLDGRFLNKIGKGYPVHSLAANLAHNAVLLSASDNIIFGCFKHNPVLFKIGPLNNELLFKKLKFNELKEFEIRGKQKGVNPPEFYSNKNTASIKKIAIALYFYSIGVDRNKNVFLCSNIDMGKKGIIFKLDSNGNLVEQFIMKFKNKIVRILKILPVSNNFFAIIELDRKAYFVKLKI